mgnify:CR=1 FL=1
MKNFFSSIYENRSRVLLLSFIGYLVLFFLGLKFNFSGLVYTYASYLFFLVVFILSFYMFLLRVISAYKKYLMLKFVTTLFTIPISSELSSRLGNLIFGIKPTYFPFLDKSLFFCVEFLVLYFILLLIFLLEYLIHSFSASSVDSTKTKFPDIGLEISGAIFSSVLVLLPLFFLGQNYTPLAKKIYNNSSFTALMFRDKMKDTPFLFQETFCNHKNQKYSPDFTYFYNDSIIICLNNKSQRFEVEKINLSESLLPAEGRIPST